MQVHRTSVAYKGPWAKAGLLITLEPWQSFFICCIFGWLRKADDLRQFRNVLLLVPRKNGKSQIAAAIGLYMLAMDGEHGAEIYSGATTEKQAWEVFRPARLMALKAKGFCDRFGVEVNASNINILENSSRFEPIIGKPGDGASPSCAIIDEYHEHATDEQFDAMETGQGAREHPLMLVITTAGSNMSGPCYALQLEAQKVLEGVQDNDSLFALIYTVDQGDNWTKLATLKKANPNFGVSVGEEFLITRQREAIESARKQGTFQTKHLDIWVGARDAYFNVQKWIECHEPGLALEQFEGHPCWLSMDLASKIDIAAVELLFKRDDGSFVRFGRYYLPEETVELGENEHYRGWMRDGWLTVTDGAAIDEREIRDDILELARRFDVRELAFDPYGSHMLIQDLMGEGLTCVEMRPTLPNFSDPMKTLDALIVSKRIAHNGDPVMTWAISNVVTKPDAGERVYPRKERPENKIDPVVALIMALGRAAQPEEKAVIPLVFGIGPSDLEEQHGQSE